MGHGINNEAPERIWAWMWNTPNIKQNNKPHWAEYKPIFNDWVTRGWPTKKHWLGVPTIHKQHTTEYVRADLHAALIAENAKLREAADGIERWLKASLNCPAHPWDVDQLSYAVDAITAYRTATGDA